MNDLKNLRKEYAKEELDIHDVQQNPLNQFQIWMNEALKADIEEPYAMTLSTADLSGKPSSRIVLLRGVTDLGFVFFTNYESKKGKELQVNPFAALNFFWPDLERQIRIEGVVSKTSSEDSEAYFHSRPKGNRLGAWASDQSRKIESKQALALKANHIEQKFEDTEFVPCPEHWGGYIIQPTYFEFWQGRPSRLHDRICYEQDDSQNWIISRLQP